MVRQVITVRICRPNSGALGEQDGCPPSRGARLVGIVTHHDLIDNMLICRHAAAGHRLTSPS
jgi:hypothetical protein